MKSENIIDKFYSSFQKRDVAAMQACYHPSAKFSDPVFGDLSVDEVRAMWAMLSKRAPELQLEYTIHTIDDLTAKASWEAAYIFSATGRQVLNKVTANFVLQDGLILQHTDHFDFHEWASQALGLKGQLLGWTSYFRNKVKAQASLGLKSYMSKKST